MNASLSEWMTRTGVKFGTSGARGLATAMTDLVCYAYARGFLQFLEGTGATPPPWGSVAVAGDHRPSTDRIMAAVVRAVEDLGHRPIHCGKIPSPALALVGLERGIPTIMVTGSHIPDDRNGIKFNKPTGEILKDDEAAMMAQVIELDDRLFDAHGAFAHRKLDLPAVDAAPGESYVRRYLDAFPGAPLAGFRLGVYQHSAVGRDVIVRILRDLGAEVVALGRSDRFIPVDTEAIRVEDVALARRWASEDRFDAIVSADGDSDRPLVSDESGEWLRGDVAGVLCARLLGADSVSTPVSSNSVVEKCEWFSEVRRTRIGSPYVVASMIAAEAAGRRCVVGYEANGGFLIQSATAPMGRPLRALPTRDAMIVMLGVLLLARRNGCSVSRLVASLPARFTASDRIQEFPTDQSRSILARFSTGREDLDHAAIEGIFGELVGSRVERIDRTDGIRATYQNEEILHLRPSGNAPELRCYSEAASGARATELCSGALAIVARIPLPSLNGCRS